MREMRIDEVAPDFTGADPDISGKVVYREFACPVTGYLLDTEIARAGDPVLHDIAPHSPWTSASS